MRGAKDGEYSPYNSLRHAARILFGRWEMWPPIPDVPNRPPTPSGDPRCAGYGAFDLIQPPPELPISAFGAGISARWMDRKVTTSGQSFATSTLDKAGIVITTATLDTQGMVVVRE